MSAIVSGWLSKEAEEEGIERDQATSNTKQKWNRRDMARPGWERERELAF